MNQTKPSGSTGPYRSDAAASATAPIAIARLTPDVRRHTWYSTTTKTSEVAVREWSVC